MYRYLAILILSPCIAFSQDVLTFNSGTAHPCEVISYEGGQFSVKLADGTIKKAPVQQVKSISFAPDSAVATSSAPDDKSPPPITPQERFRETIWGMSKAQVIKSEKTKPINGDENALMFKDWVTGSISGIDAYLMYYFVQDRLVRAKYTFAIEHSNKNDYIADFRAINDLIVEKYGQPSEDSMAWKVETHKDNRAKWGLAVSLGHAMCAAMWETSDTTIYHLLYGDNQAITHIAEYSSKALESLEESKKKSDIIGKF